MKQMTIFDLDKSNRYHGKPDYGNNKDEIVRLCIEDKFERAIPLYKCCNTEPKGMFQSCTAYCVRCYVSKHGFTVDEKEGTFTIADVLLSEETYTGEVISQKPWRMIFDIYGKRIKEVADGNKDHTGAN